MSENGRPIKNIISLSLLVFLLFSVVAPVGAMFSRVTPESLRKTLSSPQFFLAARNSVMTASAASVISLTLAMLAAWCLERVELKGKALFSAVFTAPMLLPSISHSFGLIALFGSNGFANKLFHSKFSVYGFPGIIAGSVMYSFPVAFLMLSDAFRYEDATPHHAAQALGVPPFRRFMDITLPYLSRPMLSSFFAVFAMVATDYGVPLMIGGQRITLSVLMYNKAAVMGDYGAGSVIGAVLLLPAVVAFLSDFLNPPRGRSNFRTNPIAPQSNAICQRTARFFCGVLCAVVTAPLLAFCVMAFETKYPVNPAFTFAHIRKAIDTGIGQYLSNSLLYASLSAVFGTFLAFLCAYFTARSKGPFTKALRLASLIPMAIPGISLGLSYLIFFHDSRWYGSVWIIIMANSVHFFASPYLMMRNALEEINPDLESVGNVLGISELRVVLDIILPGVKNTMAEMGGYFFVNSMMTISAVSFLAPPAPKPVALMISQFNAQLLMESAAFVSLLIFCVNLFVQCLWRYGAKPLERK